MIYDYQKPVYDKLVRTAVAHYAMLSEKIPFKPRFHRLIIGESGTGKTYLAEQVGRELNWNVLKLNTSSWVVLGARETPTWHKVVQWLNDGDKAPRLLVLDEIDKVDGMESWTRYLRAELFDLLDGTITQQTFDEDHSEITARKELKSTLIFACGAFQELFESRPELGFNGKSNTPTSSNQLSKSLQRELVNRFDNELLILPQLVEKDYIKMIEDTKPFLPAAHHDIIQEFAKERLQEAIESKSSARFMENLLAQLYYRLTSAHKPVAWSDVEHQKQLIEGMKLELEEDDDIWSMDIQ